MRREPTDGREAGAVLENVLFPNDLEQAGRLLSQCLYRPTPEKVGQWLERYRLEPELTLYVYRMRESPQAVPLTAGVIGIRDMGAGELEIRHVAVDTEYRGRGIGRAMIGDIRAKYHGGRLAAETDREAVGFYRACGFRIDRLGMRYEGTERFRCVWSGPGNAHE